MNNLKKFDIASLKAMDNTQIDELASQIRQEIIETISENGGHLASNLGVIELTLALHYVFSTPSDKIIWDVGHQSYAHKLLTGRCENFNSIRKMNGLSGFPKREESEHDCFDTGHSSTSISAALGYAKARDILGKDNCVIAVIGDGAMTGGMAFEALNHAGHCGKKMLIILNDNEMSIAHNVGAMATYLNKVRTSKFYFNKKRSIERFLKNIPYFGYKLFSGAEKIRDSLKYIFVQAGMFFEELGFKYYGPIDGHNINELIQVFSSVKSIEQPVLVHVITQKGRGYIPAEEKPEKYHGIAPFNIQSGLVKKNKTIPNYTDVFADTLIQLAALDDRIIGITAAMPEGTGLHKFAKKFPDRFFDVGIAEQHAVTFASALALEGFKPIVALYSTFSQRAYDQIVHDVALQNSQVIFALDRAGLVGEDGPTHHGVFDISFLRSIPNLSLLAPKDEKELRNMLFSALDHQGPLAIRYPRGPGVGVECDSEFEKIEWGKAELIKDGSDLLIVACGTMVNTALEVALLLKENIGINTAIINIRFIKPLDEETIIKYVQGANKVVTLEENMLAGGFGSSISELLFRQGLQKNTELLAIGLEDNFAVHGTTEELKKLYSLDTQGVYVKIVRKYFKEYSFLKASVR